MKGSFEEGFEGTIAKSGYEESFGEEIGSGSMTAATLQFLRVERLQLTFLAVML